MTLENIFTSPRMEIQENNNFPHSFRLIGNMYDFSGKNSEIGEIILSMCTDIIKTHHYKNNENNIIIENYQNFCYTNINNGDLFNYVINDKNINYIIPILYFKNITNEDINLFNSRINGNFIDILNDNLFKSLLKYQNMFSDNTNNMLLKFFKINFIDCLLLSIKYKKSLNYMFRLKKIIDYKINKYYGICSTSKKIV
jgi:hypothetical protein